MSTPYSREQLYAQGAYPTYSDECAQVAFLLGGIGTGNLSVGSRGQLMDWEIFGTAGKGNYMPNGFFAIHAEPEGAPAVTRVLESRLHPPFNKPRGFLDYEAAGLPRLAHSSCYARYPFFTVDFEDDDMPFAASLTAFTPFVPLNAEDSGIPTALLTYRVQNRTDRPMAVSVAGSMSNLSCLLRYERHTWQNYQLADDTVNEYRDEPALRGLYFRLKSLQPESLYYGSMALTTTHAEVTHKRSWLRGGWWDGLQDFWDDFRTDGRLEAEPAYTQEDASDVTPDTTGSLALHATLAPGESREFPFQISWHIPNRVRCWSKMMYDDCLRAEQGDESRPASGGLVTARDEYPTVRKYYATLFEDAWHAARYTFANRARLEGLSRAFAESLYGSTVPACVVEAVAASITVLRSNTCYRIEDGTLLAWEGCFDDEGCCEGTCTHVWNYAQTLAYLFPELEKTMRRVEYLVETDAEGKMSFRTYQLWGMGPHGHVPAADGQLGTLVRLYREWRHTGDDAFLRELWPSARRSLDYALRYWDADGDRVLDHDQFNTYDIAFQGPNSMVNSLFFAALKAGAAICRYLGDEPGAEVYEAAFRQGSARMDALLWNGEYYRQLLPDVNRYRYQYGEGCLSDQVFGQTLASLAGLGYVLPEAHIRRAVKSIYDANYRDGFATHENPQRTYALNDERGLVLCSWPRGGRPRIPFPYSDEVWTGIEAQVATLLCYEGYLDEALTLVQSVRDRHDGVKRSPWNEAECGHHYARSMASYGVYAALCGFDCNLPAGRVRFAPKVNAEDFRCFFATGKGWGVYSQKRGADGVLHTRVDTLYGDLSGVTIDAGA